MELSSLSSGIPCASCTCGYLQAIKTGTIRSDARRLKYVLQKDLTVRRFANILETHGLSLVLDGAQSVSLHGNTDQVCQSTRAKIIAFATRNRRTLQQEAYELNTESEG